MATTVPSVLVTSTSPPTEPKPSGARTGVTNPLPPRFVTGVTVVLAETATANAPFTSYPTARYWPPKEPKLLGRNTPPRGFVVEGSVAKTVAGPPVGGR